MPHIPRHLTTNSRAGQALRPMAKAPMNSLPSEDSMGILDDLPVVAEAPQSKPDIPHSKKRSQKRVTGMPVVSMKNWDVSPDQVISSMFG